MKGIVLVIFLIAWMVPFLMWASDTTMTDITEDKIIGEEIKLYMGEAKIIPVKNLKRIAIGNPNIADIGSVSKDEIGISPKTSGSTTLIFWDDFGEQSYRVKVFSVDANEIKRRVDNILEKLNFPEVYTQAVEEESKVLLLGRVKTAQERERINNALETLKDKVTDLLEVKEEEAVIEIDAQVLELNEDATNTLGFTWPSSLNLIEKGSPGISDSGTKFSTLFKVLNLQRGSSSGSDPLTFKLDALVQEGKARLLSRPRLACQSGKEAELLVGGEKPTFATYTTETATGATVEYKEYGIKLKIRPTVVDKNRIKLGLNIEVSELEVVESMGTSARAYPLKKRNTSTELFLDDGQTLAIGGLIKQKTEEDLRKTPGLGDIPGLGLFFRKKTTRLGGGEGERGNTELFITLTPKIISQEKEIEQKKVETKTGPIYNLPAEDNLSEPIIEYSKIIQKRILENLTYPTLAKEGGLEGTVKLGLHLSCSGKLLDVIVKESSGCQILDDNALSITKAISSYPPFPSTIAQKEIWVDMPIVYKLN